MQYFKPLFWGFLCMFDLRIQGFDILPDIIGYWLIYSGLSKIIKNELILKKEDFTKAQSFSLPLIFLAVFDIYQIQKPVSEFQFDPLAGTLMVISFLSMILDLLMVYHLCLGIAEEARTKEHNELEDLALHRWKIYLYIRIGIIVIMPVMMLIPPVVIVLFLPILAATIAAFALMMGLMDRAEVLAQE